MGMYFNPIPWVKISKTKRGWRVGIGPRWFREWFGRGGRGVSTGYGPFSYYKRLGRRRNPR